MKSTSEIWNEHYKRIKARLQYPDENLVRILSGLNGENKKALDFGAGSGRHSILLKNFGYNVTSVDYSQNSLDLIRETDPEINVQLVGDPPYPFSSNSYDLIVSWGVLHYNSSETIKSIVNEYGRILKKDGSIAGTIRADRDTYLKAQDGKIGISDLKGADVRLFSKKEVEEIFESFRDLQLGYMERTPMGRLDDKISHWIFLCKK